MDKNRLTGISPIAGYVENRAKRKELFKRISNPSTKIIQELYHKIMDGKDIEY